MQKPFYKGAQGNFSLHTITVALVALAAGAKQTIEEMLPIGTEIVGIRHITANLGAGTAIKIEAVEAFDAAGTATELLTVATTSADFGVTPLKRLYIGDTGPIDIVLTNTGSNPATGDVQIEIEYRFKGY